MGMHWFRRGEIARLMSRQERRKNQNNINVNQNVDFGAQFAADFLASLEDEVALTV